MLGRDLSDAEEWIRRWTAQASAQADAAQQMSEQVAALSSTATGANGGIKVTVAGSGLVTDLKLDDEAVRRPGAELAAEILSVMRRAQTGLNAKVLAVVDQTVGADSATGQAVVNSFENRFPAPDEVDGDEEERP